MNIFFNKADKGTSLRHRILLKSFIEKQLRKEGITIEALQYVFCSDEHLLNINKQFLNHDYYTDIISFDLSFNQAAHHPKLEFESIVYLD